MYSATIGARRYTFPDLKTLMGKASPLRSGDVLAGVAAETGEERVAAQFALADLPLSTFLSDQVVPYEIDDARGIAASILDGLLLGAGDAVIGINPATDSPERTHTLLSMLDEIRCKLDIPTQCCVLAHVTTTLDLIRKGSPVDLVFQSIAGTETANKSFGIDLALLGDARDAALSLRRGTVGDNVMYFETGQGSSLSA